MSLAKAAAALDRLLEGQTLEPTTFRPLPSSTSFPPSCWGTISTPTSPQSSPPNSKASFLEDTQPPEGLSLSTLVVKHSTPKDDSPRHTPPQFPLLDHSPTFQPPSSPIPSVRPHQAHHTTLTSFRAAASHSIPIPASHSIPIPASHSIPIPASHSIPIPASHSIPIPASHSVPVSTFHPLPASHSFPTSYSVPVSQSIPFRASCSVPTSYSTPVLVSTPFKPCAQASSSTEVGEAGLSEHWSPGVRGGRRGGRVLLSLFSSPDPSKFKTELCRSYQVHGYCRYGVRCNYAHGLQQVRGAVHHGKYKTRNCKSYHEMGCCRYGARCSFIHDPEEGVLKCSIANKEVLEALHYCPASEDSYRTAKITWKLVDSSSSPPPELHFITSNAQSSHHDATLMSMDTEMRHGPRELYSGQEFMSVYPPVINSASSGVLQQREGTHRSHSVPISASRFRSGKRNSSWIARPMSPRTWIKPSSVSESCLHTETIASDARLPQPSSGCPVFPARCHRGGWYDAEELMNLEVVQRILREGPHYSSTCWSPADEETDAAPSHPSDRNNCNEIRNVKIETNYVSKRELPQMKEYLPGNDNSDVLGSESEAFLEQPILCSTLRSDSDSEEANVGVSDEWSLSGGLHVKDLPSVVQDRPYWAEGWPWRGGEGRLWASASMPLRRHCHDLTKYKTELCRSFQYNSHCGYGDACLYAHGTLDLRCCPRHPMYRTKQCFSFHHKGYCLYGSRCQFMHDLG